MSLKSNFLLRVCESRLLTKFCQLQTGKEQQSPSQWALRYCTASDSRSRSRSHVVTGVHYVIPIALYWIRDWLTTLSLLFRRFWRLTGPHPKKKTPEPEALVLRMGKTCHPTPSVWLVIEIFCSSITTTGYFGVAAIFTIFTLQQAGEYAKCTEKGEPVLLKNIKL